MFTINTGDNLSHVMKDKVSWLRLYPNNFVRYSKSNNNGMQKIDCVEGELIEDKISIVNHIDINRSMNTKSVKLAHLNHSDIEINKVFDSNINLYTTDKLNVINIDNYNDIHVYPFSNNKFINNDSFLDLYYSSTNTDYLDYMIFIQLILSWFSLLIPFENTICITLSDNQVYYDNLNIKKENNINFLNADIKNDITFFFNCLSYLSDSLSHKDIKILSHLSTPFISIKIENGNYVFKYCTLSTSYAELLFLFKQIQLTEKSKKILFGLNNIYKFPYIEESLIKDFKYLDAFSILGNY